jgi:uncharacterized membrane protein YhiD involved in acid resistance
VLAWFLLAPCVQSLLPVNYAAVDTLDIALRLGTATLVGAVLGLNRDLHGKPTGVRTLASFASGRHWPFYLSKTAAAPTRAALSKVS